MKKGKRPGQGPLPEPPEPLRQALAGALAPFGSRPARTQALPILQAAQAAAGWLGPVVLAYVSRLTRIPVADLTSLATFYELLSVEPQGQIVVRVCDDVTCSLGGRARALLGALEQHLGIRPGQTTADGRFTLRTAACLGGCDRAPCALVGADFAGPLAPEQVPALLAAAAAAGPAAPAAAPAASAAAPSAPEPGPAAPPLNAPGRHGWVSGYTPVLLARCGRVDPGSLADYTARGGLTGLRLALAMEPAAVIAGVTASGLVGRGGAAFPTGAKWEAARLAPGAPKYVVLNADESEPGTYTNRKLLEEDPFLVLEGMLIAARAVGAGQGYAYIRGEYDLAARRFSQAVAAARAQGLLGAGVLDSGWAFDVEVRRGAGAYICGEETALFASIAGYRGEPRTKPPFPTTQGLFGQPTVINNAETLACVPGILQRGPAAFAAAPPKLFAVSGDVVRPGVYEAPLGTPLRRLIQECCGGFAGAPKAVLVGGAAGTWLRADQLDVALDPAGLRSAGATLGSGAIMVFNQDADLWAAGRRLARFFAEESCGKCIPCRLGTVRQLELVEHMCAHGGTGAHAELLGHLAGAMADASICGLGQTAAAPIQSLLRQFGLPGEVPAGD